MAKKAAVKKVQDIEDKLIEKFGEGVIVSGKHITDKKSLVVPVSPNIDIMTGGGIKFGSFVIPTGPAKVGKTSLALDMAATAVNMPTEFDVPRKIYFFNVEGRIQSRDLMGIHHLAPLVKDETKFKSIESYPGRILTAENYLEIAEALINEKPGSIFIIDSFSQLCSKTGREKDWDDGKAYRDDVPKFLSLFCKRISNVVPINQSIVVGVTHRIADTGFGFSSWAEASGTKIQYAVDVKLNAPWKESWKATSDSDTTIGQIVNWECLCSPLLNGAVEAKCKSRLRYGYGLDKPYELLEVGKQLGWVKKSGSWFEIIDHNIKEQGMEKLRQALIENPKVYESLNEKFREAYFE